MSVLKNDRETFKPELEFSKEELAEMEREKNKVLSEFVYNTFELEEFTTKKVQNYSGRYRHRQPDEVYHLVSSACSKIRQGNNIHPRFKEQAIKREDIFEDAIRDLHEAVTKLDIVSRLAKEDQGEKGEKKYGGKKNYARPLALFAAGAAAREYDLSSFDFVTCVPMHKRSFKKRHFNQAEELAKEFCAFTGLIYLDTLEKYKQNKPQHSMHRSARASNVKGVFRVLDKQAVRGRKILLVDDIITTGNTLGECARLLKKAGCAEVSCVTVCSTII